MASVCAVALVSAAHADTFVNGSFETGDLTGWTVGGGSWHGGAYPVPADYLPGGVNYVPSQASVSVTNPGLDPYTDNNVNMVYAGAHSVRVNDPVNNYSVSVISQRVNNYTDPLIAFAYAAVLQSSHGPTDSDAFIITLTDATTNTVLYSFNLNSATAPGVFTRSNSNWYYTNWVAQSIDVSALEGHDFILSLLANDCPYGGHAGYAYLDGFGSQQGGGGTGGGGGTVDSDWDGDGATSANNSVVDGGDGVWTTTSTNFTRRTHVGIKIPREAASAKDAIVDHRCRMAYTFAPLTAISRRHPPACYWAFRSRLCNEPFEEISLRRENVGMRVE